MKLYQIEKCPFAHRVRISLEEKKLKYDVAYFASGLRPSELEALGPDAHSPTLFDGDGTAVWDSIVVCEYLEDRYPETPLLPRDPAARARARLLVKEVETKVAPLDSPLEKELSRMDGRAPDEQKLAEMLARVRSALAPFEVRLREQPFLLGDVFSLPDVALFTLVVSMSRALGERAGVLDDRPALAAFRDRVAARPSTAY